MTEIGNGRRAPIMARIKDYLEFAGILLVVTSAVLGVVWSFARNEVQAGAQALIGLPEFSESINNLASATAANTEATARNAAAIEALTPVPAVAEYDTLRSRIWSPCVIGVPCEYQLRVRRTDYGLGCGAPEVVARIVTDRSGLQYQVIAGGAGTTSRLGGEWAAIASAFVMTQEIQLGVAEFRLVLGYHCGGVYREEASPDIVFEISE